MKFLALPIANTIFHINQCIAPVLKQIHTDLSAGSQPEIITESWK